MLKIHEFSASNGLLSSIHLRGSSEGLEIVSDDGVWGLPRGALLAVLTRYGAPFDPNARSTVIDSLALSPGECLRHVRHLAGYDVIARDYLVYERPGEEAVCALAATVTAALLHLGRAQSTRG